MDKFNCVYCCRKILAKNYNKHLITHKFMKKEADLVFKGLKVKGKLVFSIEKKFWKVEEVDNIYIITAK